MRGKPSNTWLNQLETETRSRTRARADLPQLRVSGLTVLWHADPERVGEHVALPELTTGREAQLSRLTPLFAPMGGGDARPLAEPRLSRSPILLVPRPDGGLVVDARATRTHLQIAGEAVSDSREVSSDEIQRGVVLLLGERVALLLHETRPSTERPPRLGMIGESPAMLRLRREIQRVANLEMHVLLRGESGTGKELAARAIHEASSRRRGPFLAVNIAAVPPTLAAAELFGSAKGAFSGADRRRPGYFQRAAGGSLFLDEIGDTPAEVQVQLLRVLESGEVQPVGAEVPQPVDARVIAATDADLETATAEGRFKGSLLHRLSGYEIFLPPLRRRRQDIGRLFVHFLRQELETLGEAHRLAHLGPRARPWVPAELVARLAAYDWPGNVRQLRNVVRQLAVASRGAPEVVVDSRLQALLTSKAATAEPRAARREDAGSADAADRSAPSPKREAVYREPGDIGETELLEALRAHAFQPRATAEALGISRTSLYALIDRCPKIRKASELSRDEIEAAAERCDGRLGDMAAKLEVSAQGLKRRMKSLGLR